MKQGSRCWIITLWKCERTVVGERLLLEDAFGLCVCRQRRVCEEHPEGTSHIKI